jgi:hypothetical protein
LLFSRQSDGGSLDHDLMARFEEKHWSSLLSRYGTVTPTALSRQPLLRCGLGLRRAAQLATLAKIDASTVSRLEASGHRAARGQGCRDPRIESAWS